MSHFQNRSSSIPAIASIVMLTLAVFARWPYGFYTLLRIIVTVSAIYVAVQANRAKKIAFVWLMVAAALLFNPLVPLLLSRSQWRPIDLAASIAFALWLFTTIVGSVRRKAAMSASGQIVLDADQVLEEIQNVRTKRNGAIAKRTAPLGPRDEAFETLAAKIGAKVPSLRPLEPPIASTEVMISGIGQEERFRGEREKTTMLYLMRVGRYWVRYNTSLGSFETSSPELSAVLLVLAVVLGWLAVRFISIKLGLYESGYKGPSW